MWNMFAKKRQVKTTKEKKTKSKKNLLFCFLFLKNNIYFIKI